MLLEARLERLAMLGWLVFDKKTPEGYQVFTPKELRVEADKITVPEVLNDALNYTRGLLYRLEGNDNDGKKYLNNISQASINYKNAQKLAKEEIAQPDPADKNIQPTFMKR